MRFKTLVEMEHERAARPGTYLALHNGDWKAATEHAEADHSFPHIDRYIIAHACPQCHARSGDPCVVARGRRQWHMRRVDLGIKHRVKDQETAPWPEERIVGHDYATVPR